MFSAVLFDLDNTLFDTRTMAYNARVNALNAMVEAGLDVEVEEGLKKLLSIVKKMGSNFDNHFDILLKSYGMDPDPHVVAAGVVAYHETKKAYLVPYSDTVPTLLKLKKAGVKIGVVSNGRPVKQWEKIIRLGLQHFFDVVVIRDKDGKPNPEPLLEAAAQLGVEPGECLMVGDKSGVDVAGAKAACMKSVLLLKKYAQEEGPKPDFEVGKIRDILGLIDLDGV